MLKSFVLFVVCLAGICGWLSPPVRALTRATTPGTGETSLIYWRYLCRGQPQEEIKTKTKREIVCPLQRWRVSTHPGEDRVIEVVEDAS